MARIRTTKEARNKPEMQETSENVAYSIQQSKNASKQFQKFMQLKKQVIKDARFGKQARDQQSQVAFKEIMRLRKQES